MERNSIFISYSHADRKWLKELNVHLDYIERDHNLNVWHDGKIKIGTDWLKSIEEAMKSAKIGLLLVSANFLRSDFIRESELPKLLSNAEKEGARIFSLIISDCMFEDFTAISKYQSFNSTDNPLDKMKKSERNTLFKTVTKTIKDTLSKQLKPLNSNHHNIQINIIDEALTITKILNTLHGQDEFLSISELLKKSNLTNRKNMFKSLNTLFEENLVIKHKLNGNTKWKISKKGTEKLEKYK